VVVSFVPLLVDMRISVIELMFFVLGVGKSSRLDRMRLIEVRVNIVHFHVVSLIVRACERGINNLQNMLQNEFKVVKITIIGRVESKFKMDTGLLDRKVVVINKNIELLEKKFLEDH